MVEQKDKEKEQVEVPEGSDTLRVGDIVLSSRYYLVPDLIKILKEDILKDKDIKRYIQLLEIKKSKGDYVG